MHAHHWLILHGRYICKARTPECWRCNAAAWCGFQPKTPPPAEKRPSAKPRGRITATEIEDA
jgi:endonuclease-3